MMDKRRNESSPETRPSGITPGFKIPKKKPDDWCESISVSSPLSRMQNREFQNVTYRKRASGSSYETFNVPRNKNTHSYYTLKFDRQPKIILKDILRSGQEKETAHKNISGTPTKNFNELYQERQIGTKYEAQRPLECKEQTQASPSSKVCRDVSNTSISSHKHLNSRPRKSTSPVLDSQGASKAQEKRNALKDIELSPARREQTYCCKRVEHQNKKKSLSSSSTDLSDSSSEPITDCTVPCMLNTPRRKTIARQKMKSTAEENNKSSDDGWDSGPTRSTSQSGVYSTKRKKLLPKDDRKENPPIILSSDEDEAGHEEKKTGCAQSTVKKISLERKCPSPTKDAEPIDHCGILKAATTTPEQSDTSVLQLKCLNVYYGRKGGRVSEMAKFSATSVEIPLKVAFHKMTCLTVETRKVQKYGLWFTNGGDSVRSSVVIVLWISPSYVPFIEKKMDLAAKNQAVKSNEFIFLELAEPITGKEQSLLSEIMVEASKYGLSSLSEVLSCDEMFSIVESLPFEECSFKLNCCSFQSQPPKAKKVKSTYSLMHKMSNGCYSFSMVPEQHIALEDAHKSGVAIRLLVYPPPPTKGGLAVSNEDLQCLEHGEFLNDVIIDFYLKYLMLEIFPKPFAEKCHIFSSFFFKCLTRKENCSNDINSETSTAERRHQRVKNWTRHVDIFKKDFIFVPVNENSHWYLAVICFPWLEKTVYEDRKEQNVVSYSKTKGSFNSGSVIVFNDRLSKTEETAEDSNSGSESSSGSGKGYTQKYPKPKESHIGKVCKRPCILIFDSLKIGSVKSTVQVLREYLNVEYQVKQKSEREFSRSSMRELYPKVPKQNNSTDCGLYLLQYVESFSQVCEKQSSCIVVFLFFQVFIYL
ncbi:sentrin-specific protease 7 isoform X2 [Pyxicephalus adspersus]|uniref:sentrin-specific protease 7 isoform X2 n=1 Tax=Pyxicephalus adspersus TaxID=30357 RepID=UPI003B5B619F